MKKVTIGEKEYSLECNAFTRVLYKKIFGRAIFKDISLLTDFFTGTQKIDKENISEEEKEEKKNKETLENYDDILDVIMQLAYIEIYTHDRQFMSYEEWLESLNKVSITEGWVTEVVNTATECFC